MCWDETFSLLMAECLALIDEKEEASPPQPSSYGLVAAQRRLMAYACTHRTISRQRSFGALVGGGMGRA